MQTGRSMVEMLGVLAVMAIIGLSAFKGVDYVLTKNTVSNIWKEVLVRSSAIRSHSRGNEHISGFDNNAHDVVWAVHTPENNPCSGTHATVGIRLTRLNARICQMLIERAQMERPNSLTCLYAQTAGPRANQMVTAHVPPRPSDADCTNLVFGFTKGGH